MMMRIHSRMSPLTIRIAATSITAARRTLAEGHEWAALEPIGKSAGRQRHQEPREAVGGGNGGNGDGVGIDHYGEQWHGPQQEPVARAGDGEADPKPGEGAPAKMPRLPRDAHFRWNLPPGQRTSREIPLRGWPMAPSAAPARDDGGSPCERREVLAQGGRPPCRYIPSKQHPIPCIGAGRDSPLALCGRRPHGQPHLVAKSLIGLHLPLLASQHGRGNVRAVHRATGALHIPAP